MLRQHLFRLVNWISRRFFANRLSYAHVQAFLFNNSLLKLTNLARVSWEMYRGRAVTRSKPYILILEPTNVCNLHCPFCLTGKGISGGRQVRHMAFAEARPIIDDLADTLYFLQMYTWGEPLLNKDTLSMIEYAKGRGVYVMLSTNATTLTPENNRRLIAGGIDYIMVSIDGGSAATYPIYRKGGDYDKVLANVRDLLAQRRTLGRDRPFVEWQYVVFRHNEHEVDATERLAYEIGVDRFTPLPAYVEDPQWLPTNRKYRTTLLNPERILHCERPWTHFNVRADGGVASCCYEFFKQDDFDTLGPSRFADVWNNAHFQQSRRLLHQARRGEPLEPADIICRECIRTGVRPSYIETAGEPVAPPRVTLEIASSRPRAAP